MRFNFTDEKGDTYCVEVIARRDRNSRSSKKATLKVAAEIAHLIKCAAYHYKCIGCNHLRGYAERNANEVIIAVQSF